MDLKCAGDNTPWSLSFDEHFNASHSESTKSELKAIAQRYDFEPFEERLTNTHNNTKWTNSGVLFTNKTTSSGLTEVCSTDYHDDHSHTFCYLCSIDEQKTQLTKSSGESKKNRLIPYKNPKAPLLSLASDQTKKQLSSPPSDWVSYRFIVRTGAKKNGGTRAQVFLYLFGTEHNWTSVHLPRQINSNSSKCIDGFPSGSVRTFCMKGPNIGQLHHLNVNLVGCRSDREWFLKEIEITNLNSGTTWLCEFDCWLPTRDKQQINENKPTTTTSSSHTYSEPSPSMYILQILTGEKSHIDNNAIVLIKIRGSINRSCQLIIKNNHTNLFRKNQLDTYAIIGSDLGDLLEITVESVENRSEINCHIKDLIIRKIVPNDECKQSQIYFPFNICLNKRVNRFCVKKELYPIMDHQFKGPICYHIIVKTGNVTNAGTNLNVFIVMYGKSGRTAIHQINNRSKNDLEQNVKSEYYIMDLDIGTIDKIRIWHDNSNLSAAWFLETVIIRKKYSTCHLISSIYTQRIEHISKALYHQHSDLTKSNPITRRHSKTNDDHATIDRQSLKSKNSDSIGFNDRLNCSRSILRSPTLYDKANLRKKVTWDEQSISSQEDMHPTDSSHIRAMDSIDEQEFHENDSFSQILSHTDHEIHWISSHNFTENRWKIQSIEEINPFDFDSSLFALLLSDRLVIDNDNMKTRNKENDDEIYEFSANCWLKKDKPSDKLEIYLTPNAIHKSSLLSDDNHDFKVKHRNVSHIHSDIHHQQHDNKEQLKFSSPHSLTIIEKSSRNLSPDNFSSQSSHLLKVKSSHSQSTPDKIHPLSHSNSMMKKQDESPKIHLATNKYTQSSSLTTNFKSPRHLNTDFINSLASEGELLSRITAPERSHHIQSTDASLLPLSQHSKYSLERVVPTANDQSSSSKNFTQSRLSTEHVKSSHKINTHNSLTKISDDLPNYARSTTTSISTLNRSLKSSYDNNEIVNSETTERKLPKRISNQSSSHSRSLTDSLSPHAKLASHSDNNLSHSFINKRETSLKMSIEPSANSLPIMSSLLSSSPLSRTTIPLNNDFSSPLPRPSTEFNLKSKLSKQHNPVVSLEKPINNQLYKSSHGASSLEDF